MLETLIKLKAFLEGKPSKTWCTGMYVSRLSSEIRYCGLGHMYYSQEPFEVTRYMMMSPVAPLQVHEIPLLEELYSYLLTKGVLLRLRGAGGAEADHPLAKTIDQVNDGHDSDYQQFTPKERVIAFISDVIAMLENDQAEVAVKEVMKEVETMELVEA